AADVPADLRIPIRLTVSDDDLEPHRQPVLARENVRYVGEPVAVVVAEDPYTAEDAAELVALDIDDRTPVLNAEDDDAPVVADLRVGFGDVQGAFRDADHVVTLDFEVGRHSA